MIGISREKWASTKSQMPGFALCPAGVGLLFEITNHSMGTREPTERDPDGTEWVRIVCTHHDEEGTAYDRSEFFDFSEEGLPRLKWFLEAIGREDIMDDEEADWKDLYGTTFKCDVEHYKTGKKSSMPGVEKDRFAYKTLIAVSHGKKKPGNGQSKAAKPAPVDDLDEDRPTKRGPGRPKREEPVEEDVKTLRAARESAVKAAAPAPTAYEDDDDDDDRPPRRPTRGADR